MIQSVLVQRLKIDLPPNVLNVCVFLSFFVFELLDRNVVAMELSDFVEQNLSSTLNEVRKKHLKDRLLSIYEIALIYHYSESGYESTNETLIKNKGIITTDYAKYLALTLSKLPDYQEVVFRGIVLNQTQKQQYLDANEKNIAIKEPLFLSTSKSESIANLFSKGDTFFSIYCETGKQIEKFSKFGLNSGQNEKEVLFLPNTVFDVLEVRKDNTKTLITLQENI